MGAGGTGTVAGAVFGVVGGGAVAAGGAVTKADGAVGPGGGESDGGELAPVGAVGDDDEEPPPENGVAVVGAPPGVGAVGAGTVECVGLDAGFFPGAALALGFVARARGGAPEATSVPPPRGVVVDAPDAGAVAPIEAMIERKAEKLRPATRMRVPAAGWRRRRRLGGPGAGSSGVGRARRAASRASRSSRSGIGSVTRTPQSGPPHSGPM